MFNLIKQEYQMNADEIIAAVRETIGSTELSMKAKSNKLIMLQALAAVDSPDTGWAVTMMTEPFIMELDEIEANEQRKLDSENVK